MKTNNITYRRVGDFNISNLILPPEEVNIRIGKWGMSHKDYLIKNKKVVFATLLAKGKLWQYLTDVDTQAQHMFDTLVKQMKEREDVTEQLKEKIRLILLVVLSCVTAFLFCSNFQFKGKQSILVLIE